MNKMIRPGELVHKPTTWISRLHKVGGELVQTEELVTNIAGVGEPSIAQHLYLTVEEEVVSGDYVLDGDTLREVTGVGQANVFFKVGKPCKRTEVVKVIASTNTELRLLSISIGDISWYINNQDGVVGIEYYTYEEGSTDGEEYTYDVTEPYTNINGTVKLITEER